MKSLITTVVSGMLLATSLSAQEKKAAITVFPFGIAQSASNAGRDVANSSANRAVEGVLATERLSVVDSTASKRIQNAIQNASGIEQFNSEGKQVELNKQLQSNYLLLGYIEGADSKPLVLDNKREVIYAAVMHVTLQVQDVQNGSVVVSKKLDVGNGFIIPPIEECKGFSSLSCQARNKMKQMAADKANEDIAKRLPTGGADTPQKAFTQASDKMKDAVESFINDALKKGALK